MSNNQWNDDQSVGERALRKYQRIVDNAELLLATLEGVATWCHQGHGSFSQEICGLCKPVLETIKKARGER